MKSSKRGMRTSNNIAVNVSTRGIWVFVQRKEYFLPYKDFPWFKKARRSEINHVKLIRDHLRWEDLDVDLALDSLEHPERYPLKYR